MTVTLWDKLSDFKDELSPGNWLVLSSALESHVQEMPYMVPVGHLMGNDLSRSGEDFVLSFSEIF